MNPNQVKKRRDQEYQAETKTVAKFLFPDWVIQSTLAQGCRTGPPGDISWRAGTAMPASTISPIQELRIWLLFCECVIPKNLTLIPSKAKKKITQSQKSSQTPFCGCSVLWLFYQTNKKNNQIFNLRTILALKETVSRNFFASDFFYESSSPQPLKITLESFQIFLKIRKFATVANNGNNIRLLTTGK